MSNCILARAPSNMTVCAHDDWPCSLQRRVVDTVSLAHVKHDRVPDHEVVARRLSVVDVVELGDQALPFAGRDVDRVGAHRVLIEQVRAAGRARPGASARPRPAAGARAARRRRGLPGAGLPHVAPRRRPARAAPGERRQGQPDPRGSPRPSSPVPCPHFFHHPGNTRSKRDAVTRRSFVRRRGARRARLVTGSALGVTASVRKSHRETSRRGGRRDSGSTPQASPTVPSPRPPPSP